MPNPTAETKAQLTPSLVRPALAAVAGWIAGFGPHRRYFLLTRFLLARSAAGDALRTRIFAPHLAAHLSCVCVLAAC